MLEIRGHDPWPNSSFFLADIIVIIGLNLLLLMDALLLKIHVQFNLFCGHGTPFHMQMEHDV